MPRTSSTPDDQTPLTGPRIDVPARIGWLLRSTRVSAGLTLREMAAALGDHGVDLSAASVSRLENEGRRSDAALRGYALVAGMEEHRLLITVDELCRSFSYAPGRGPVEPMSMADFDAACEAVCAEQPTGHDWWRFAWAQLQGTGFGLPSRMVAEHARRAAVELQRSHGGARMSRWSALVYLSSERYCDAVHAALLPLVFEPDGQRPDDLLGILAEHPSAGSLTLLTDLLSDPSTVMARQASYCVQSLLVMGGIPLESWQSAVPALRAGWEAAGGDHERLSIMTALTNALPPSLQAELRPVARPVDIPDPTPADWSRSRRNAHYAYAADVAKVITESRGLADDPMLARLLFEAFFETRGVRKSMASWLLRASSFAPDLAARLPDVWDHGPEAGSRATVARLGAFCQAAGDAPDVTALLGSAHAQEFQHGLTYHAHGGTPLPQPALARGLAGDEETRRRTLFCLGMTGDPRLDALSTDAGRSEDIRGAARWWLARGPGLVE